MATIRIVFEKGEPEPLIQFDAADAPFQHDGRPGSILELGHRVYLEHACADNCASSICHVIVKRGFSELSEASEQGEDLLDRAPSPTVTSRLGSQAVEEDPAAEIAVVVSHYTIKQVNERDHAVA